jgi:uncharacterized protein
MIIILAPSKTLDFDTPAPDWVTQTQPIFQDQASRIAAELANLSKSQLVTLMHVSDSIAATNHVRMAKWGQHLKEALWAYRGDVYKGMYADRFSHKEADWAQRHLIIMSGLYGALRPYDAISPYRLEMKAKLPVEGSKDLYGFWGTRLAEYVDSQSDGIICNLSSDEYARPVTRYCHSRIITPVFMDHRPNGTIGPAPIYNKMMRGVMAHWMITRSIDDPSRLSEFSAHGYYFDPSRSTSDAPVFLRDKMTPLVFI